jgi:hypothetical protein
MTTLNVIPQQNFQKYIQQWQHRWAKYIAAQGKYSEGYPSQYAVHIQVLQVLGLQ